MELILFLSVIVVLFAGGYLFGRSKLLRKILGGFNLKKPMVDQIDTHEKNEMLFSLRKKNLPPILEGLANIALALPYEVQRAGIVSWEDEGDHIVLNMLRRPRPAAPNAGHNTGSGPSGQGGEAQAGFQPALPVAPVIPVAPSPPAEAATPTADSTAGTDESHRSRTEEEALPPRWPALVISWILEELPSNDRFSRSKKENPTVGMYTLEWVDGSVTKAADAQEMLILISRIIRERLG